MFLLENVKGLLNHDRGNTFATILQTIDELGYDAEWEVLNSKHFGVPQNRERVFIIGHLRGEGFRQVFPLRRNSQETNSENAYTISAVTGLKKVNAYPTLDTMYKKGLGSKQAMACVTGTWRTHNDGKGFRKMSEPISPAIPARAREDGSGQPCIAIPVLTPDRPEKRQNGRRFKENGEPMFTLTGQDKHGVMLDSRIRRLTPTECERLQGFPDKWTEGISDTQRYKTLGNAVTTNVITAIMEKIFTLEEVEE